MLLLNISVPFWKVIISIDFFLFLSFINYFIVVQLQLSAFSPHHSPQPQPAHLPPLLTFLEYVDSTPIPGNIQGKTFFIF